MKGTLLQMLAMAGAGFVGAELNRHVHEWRERDLANGTVDRRQAGWALWRRYEAR